MGKFKQASVGRRRFLKGAAAGAAALVAPSGVVRAQEQDDPPPQTAGRGGGAANQAQPEQESGTRPAASVRIVQHPGSDHMVDVIKELGIEFVAANPGSSFDGLHESLINYGNNTKPEFITCCHEESSVAAHGYAKIENKPMLAMLHGTVGIQHARYGDIQRLCGSRGDPHDCRSGLSGLGSGSKRYRYGGDVPRFREMGPPTGIAQPVHQFRDARV